jgi:hypothetical protein
VLGRRADAVRRRLLSGRQRIVGIRSQAGGVSRAASLLKGSVGASAIAAAGWRNGGGEIVQGADLGDFGDVEI